MIGILKAKQHLKIRGGGHKNDCEWPSHCPICNVNGNAIQWSDIANKIDDNIFSVAFLCANPDCSKLFVCYYNGANKIYDYAPRNPVIEKVKESIAGISHGFVDIYNQAMQAKGLGLKDVAGPGLRKSLEFLIKDFAIKQKPEQQDSIKSRSLTHVIKDYISHPKIVAIAERAAWLGNDETHYSRQWVEKDIDDLVTLINLTAEWLDVEIESTKTLESMPQK